ncbi:MAG: hypothetical protein NUV97_03755 [archaeon]|nr:hypothetical protein [archaeon]
MKRFSLFNHRAESNITEVLKWILFLAIAVAAGFAIITAVGNMAG